MERNFRVTANVLVAHASRVLAMASRHRELSFQSRAQESLF
jgi:hypothetical protein